MDGTATEGQLSADDQPSEEARAALENGLGRTPVMGWNSWNKLGCNGLTDSAVRGIADAMVSSGMAAVGYKYINLDDCWQLLGRDAARHVRVDTAKFPNGIKALADYVHGKGLKLGIYSDHGNKTCAGREGSHGYETVDANDYAAWGVDLLKYDNCNLVDNDMQVDYTRMGNALAASGRPIVYSICAWSFQSWMPSVGNYWRTTGDIWDNWGSMTGNFDNNAKYAANAKPGAFNDPDMLEVGNGGMTDTEYRSHFSLWAIASAPLIAGNDLRTMSAATKAILTAKEIIDVDQDPLGKQGTLVYSSNGLQIYSKIVQGTGVRVAALFNRSAATATMTVSWTQLGLAMGSATVRDLWAKTDRGTFTNSYSVSVPSHGTAMLRVVGKSDPTQAGYTRCASENGTCTFSGTASVAYGANNLFNYKTATTSIACNNATFGDPISGVTKACYYKKI
jgi:alpha-galactosidase